MAGTSGSIMHAGVHECSITSAGLSEPLPAGRVHIKQRPVQLALLPAMQSPSPACRRTPGREGRGEGDLERMGWPVIWA